MSFINFLRTGRRSSKKLQPTRRLTQVELFESCWDSLKKRFEMIDQSGDEFITFLRTQTNEMIDLLYGEKDLQNSTPPCYEYLLSKDVIRVMCRFTKRLKKTDIRLIHTSIIIIADVVLAAGSADRPLLGHHSQIIIPTTELIKHLLPDLGCIPGSHNTQDTRLHHAFLYLLYSLGWQLSSSPECTGFFIDAESNESYLIHAIPYIGSDGFIQAKNIDPNLENKILFLSDLSVEIVECLTTVWYPECVTFLNDISPLLSTSIIQELSTLLTQTQPAKLLKSPDVLERITIRLRFLTSVELFSMSPKLHVSLLNYYKESIVTYFESFFERGLLPTSSVIACMRFVISNLHGKSFYEPLCDILLSKIGSLVLMLSTTDSRSIQVLLLLSTIVEKSPSTARQLLGSHEDCDDDSVSLSALRLSILFHNSLFRDENRLPAHRDASANYRKPNWSLSSPNTSQGLDPEGGVYPAVVNLLKRSIQVELLIAVLCFLSNAIRSECKEVLQLLFDKERGLLSCVLKDISKEIESFTSKHGIARVRHLVHQSRRELGIIGGLERLNQPPYDLIFCKWVIIEEWRAELEATVTAHQEAVMLQKMSRKTTTTDDRSQPPPLFSPLLGENVHRINSGINNNAIVFKHPRDNPVKVA